MQVISGPVVRERVHCEAPKLCRIPQDMEAFIAWFNAQQDIDPVLKAGVAHLWFVTIHPFEDGNARIARHRGHAACTLSAALLQHVRADTAGAQRLLQDSGGNPERRSRHHRVATVVS
jgi:hypothetical protein